MPTTSERVSDARRQCTASLPIGTDPTDYLLNWLQPNVVFGGVNVLSTNVISSGWLSFNHDLLRCNPANPHPVCIWGRWTPRWGNSCQARYSRWPWISH